jgi:superfamily II DNA or RNA helicase
MPTGSGKTGVMAVAANYFNKHYDHGSCLIVVPSRYLTDQVARAINGDYWRVVQKRPRKPIPAVVFRPSTIIGSIDRYSGPVAFVCTQKTLSDIHSKEPEKYARLAGRIGVVFVDEGHREPAITWARAVRSFGKPTVLFSATPYRKMREMRVKP